MAVTSLMNHNRLSECSRKIYNNIKIENSSNRQLAYILRFFYYAVPREEDCAGER